MKLPVLFIIAAIFLSSCGTVQYTIGMTRADFVAANRKAYLLSEDVNGATYRTNKLKAFYGQIYKFYYFDSKGLLFAVDEGQAPPDVIVEGR